MSRAPHKADARAGADADADADAHVEADAETETETEAGAETETETETENEKVARGTQAYKYSIPQQIISSFRYQCLKLNTLHKENCQYVGTSHSVA